MRRRDFLKMAAAATFAAPLLWERAAHTAIDKSKMLSTIDNGLPRAEPRQHVIIIGAGMAGLVAAYELKKAGHRVTIIEASRRVGGRVWTLREPFTHGLYAEGGAMRIPDSHRLTWRYIHQFGLATQPFIMRRTGQYVLINGTRKTWREFQRDPTMPGFDLKPEERGKFGFCTFGGEN